MSNDTESAFEPSLEQCDPDIYANGTVIGIVVAPKSVIEAIVQEARLESGQKVDWHYVAGRGVIKALGDVGAAQEALQAANPERFSVAAPETEAGA